jgi:hypothetical protein
MQLLTEIDDFERQVWQKAPSCGSHKPTSRISTSPPLGASSAAAPATRHRPVAQELPACDTGKTWLARALGRCRGFSPTSLSPRGDDRYPRPFRSLCRTRLSILDDWGPEPMTAEQRRDPLEIVEDRYGRASTLLTSQLPVSRWHDIVGEPTLADTILDRIVHHAQRIELKGDSLRKRPRAPL